MEITVNEHGSTLPEVKQQEAPDFEAMAFQDLPVIDTGNESIIKSYSKGAERIWKEHVVDRDMQLQDAAFLYNQSLKKIEALQEENNRLKFELQQHKFGSFGEGGRHMMLIIISMLESKKENVEDAIHRGLTKEIDFLTGRQSAFRDILHILKKDLNNLSIK